MIGDKATVQQPVAGRSPKLEQMLQRLEALIARFDANTTGKTWFSPVQNNSVQTEIGVPGNYSKTARDAFTLVNARVGYNAPNWALTAWVRNLGNKGYLSEVIPAPEFGGSFDQQGAPRSFGLDFRYQFAGGNRYVRLALALPAYIITARVRSCSVTLGPPYVGDGRSQCIYWDANLPACGVPVFATEPRPMR